MQQSRRVLLGTQQFSCSKHSRKRRIDTPSPAWREMARELLIGMSRFFTT
jgi:hypothetical protein